MNKKTINFIYELEYFMDSGLLSQNVYSVLGNAIEMLKDGRFSKREAMEYIADWIEKLRKRKYDLTTMDESVYKKVKPKAYSGVLSSLAYSISAMFR
ncbi:hypothetical protein [Lactococcus petauri]|uniref:hypothetical protein n=1 Tax=Lactococcus petauri TaxID=1940789 RepID=UPI001F56235C|nr:hypothetical protein [Lactococcus petauri]